MDDTNFQQCHLTHISNSNSKIIILFVLLFSIIGNAQLSTKLLEKLRYPAEEFYVSQDTLSLNGYKNYPMLTTYINNKGPYKFLIDLGSNIMVYKESVVKESGMEVVVDRNRGDIVSAQKFKIGNSTFIDVHGASYEDLDVDGVIGYNLLRETNFAIDYPNRIFSFLEGDTISNPDDRYIKYETPGRMPYLKSKIGNKEVVINFNTGAELWLYFPYSWKDSLKLKEPIKEFKKMTNNQTGTVMTYIGQLEEDIFFGNYKMPQPYVVFDKEIEDAFVGGCSLQDFKLSFYTTQELVKMERSNDSRTIIVPVNQTKCDK